MKILDIAHTVLSQRLFGGLGDLALPTRFFIAYPRMVPLFTGARFRRAFKTSPPSMDRFYDSHG